MEKHRDSVVPQRAARTAAAIAGPGWFLLYLCVLLTTLYIVGTDPALYYRLQTRADILPSAGISEAELRETDEALADYLRGDVSALEAAPFNSDEKTHMADCLALFKMLKTAVILTGMIGLILVLTGTLKMGYRGFKAQQIAMLCVLLPALIAAIWAIVDFNGLFIRFHKILFTNDLWLMDPEKDLMIRICPESMFECMAAIVAAVTVAFMTVVNVTARIVYGKDRRH